MRAWLVETPKPAEEQPLQPRELPLPVPGPGQARLLVLACGVCRTDLHIAEGDLALHRRPVVPGHQIAGVVEAVGPGVTRLKVGERVGVTWLAESCGQCEQCREGAENLCPRARFTGYDVDGGFAEHVLVNAGFAARLPPGLDPLAAAPLLCAGVIGYRSLRRSGIQPGQRLGLVGFGASAHLVIQVARYWGCEVYVFTRGREHQAHARKLGAAWAGEIGDAPPAPCHAAILFAPVGALVPACLRILRPGGTLAINAVHMSDIPALPYDLLFYERSVCSVSHVTRRDAEEFLALAAQIPVQAESVVYPFAAANQALLDIKRSAVAGAAVLDLLTGASPAM